MERLDEQLATNSPHELWESYDVGISNEQPSGAWEQPDYDNVGEQGDVATRELRTLADDNREVRTPSGPSQESDDDVWNFPCQAAPWPPPPPPRARASKDEVEEREKPERSNLQAPPRPPPRSEKIMRNNLRMATKLHDR